MCETCQSSLSNGHLWRYSVGTYSVEVAVQAVSVVVAVHAVSVEVQADIVEVHCNYHVSKSSPAPQDCYSFYLQLLQ